MPSGRICLAILAFWIFMTQDLVRRDVVPNLILGPPPDFRTIAQAGTSSVSAWTILASDSIGVTTERPIGEVRNETMRRSDGSMRFASVAQFQTESLLSGTPFRSFSGEDLQRLEVIGACEIDQSGNLSSFRVTLREEVNPSSSLIVLDGRLRGDRVQVETQGILPMMNGVKEFPYRPHSMVQNTFGPMDHIPGLQIGQRWETRVVNPLSGKVEVGTSEVIGRQHIHWNHNPVPTLVILTRMGPLSAKTWVRSDGLVIRQEVPLLVKKLLLERVPDDEVNSARMKTQS